MTKCIFLLKSAAALLLTLGQMTSHAHATPVSLQNATATFSQGGFSVSSSIDGSVINGVGWAVNNNAPYVDQIAVFETVSDLTAPAITIDMLHRFTATHLVGKFRWSVTADDRSTFADGLQTGGDVTANWTELVPTSVVLPVGMTYIQTGNTILTGGVIPVPVAVNDYALAYNLPFANITGFRLEVFTDPSLPQGGFGGSLGHAQGNFVLTEVQITAVPEPGTLMLLLLGSVVLISVRIRRRRAA